MNIGRAGQQSGLCAKTIRYDEEVNLVVSERQANGWRTYDSRYMHEFCVLRRARNLSLSIGNSRLLFILYEDRERVSVNVKSIVGTYFAEIDDKFTGLQSLCDALARLVCACRDDEMPDCPILDGLAGEAGSEH